MHFVPRWRRTAPLLSWQGRRFSQGSEDGPRPSDHRDDYEREVGCEPPGEPLPDGPHRRAAAAILRYDIFPPSRIEPVLSRTPIEIGTTVGALYHLLPLLDVFFASRVTACFDGPEGGWFRTGFTYRTLDGHPEMGEETFSAEKELTTGIVRVALRSWSRPGTWVTRIGRPALRAVQVGASRAALEHLAELARSTAGP